MLPYDTILKPIQLAEVLLCLPIFLCGIGTLWLRRIERTYVPKKASILSLRSGIGLLRWAQGFCLGMLLAFCATSLFITHEHVRYSHARLINLQVTSTTHPTATPHENR